MCVHACVYLGHCAQDGGGLWGGFRMLTVGVLRGPELYTEEGLEWPHRVLCHVACLAVVGEVIAHSGCDRPEPPSLRGPFPPSAGQQFRPRACLIGTCVRNQSWAVPGGPGRHRPFQWDSLGTPGARRWAAALPTAPPHTCLALPAGLPPGHTRGPPPAPAPAPVCSVAEAPVPGLWENMLRVGEGSLGLAFPPPHSRQGAAHGWGRGCLPLRAPAPHT